MENFLRSFRAVRDAPNLVPSSNKGFPKELHQTAKELVKTDQHQYSVLPMYDIILTNLEGEKSIQEIKEGLFNISKYPLCLYLDQDRPEFHQIRTFSGYYTYELKEKLASFEQILEALGYRYDAPSQLFKLDDETRLSATFDDRIAKIGCDLVLALEELDLYDEMSKANYILPIPHFSSRRSKLQPNYQPAELQYTQTPAVPPRIHNRPNYALQPTRDDAQYSNISHFGLQHQQGDIGGDEAERARYEPSTLYDQYHGMQQGQDLRPNQGTHYSQQGHDPRPNQGALYSHQGQDLRPNLGTHYSQQGHDPRPNQGALYSHQGQDLRPNLGTHYSQQGHDPRPNQGATYTHQEQNTPYVNPGANQQAYQEHNQGYTTNPVYEKADHFAQNQQTNPSLDSRAYPSTEQTPQIHHRQDPSDVQGPFYASQDQNPNQLYQQDPSYNPNPSDVIQRAQDFTQPAYAKSDPFPQTQRTQDPVHNTQMYPGQDPVHNTQLYPGQDPVHNTQLYPGQDPVHNTQLYPGQDPVHNTQLYPGQDPVHNTQLYPGQDPVYNTQLYPGQDPVYNTQTYPGQDPGSNQTPPYTRNEQTLQTQNPQDRYPQNPAHPATHPYKQDPAYNPNASYGRTGAYTNPQPGQDIRYPANRNPEQAEVDVVPTHRPLPNLAQGNEESRGSVRLPPAVTPGSMPPSAPRDDLHGGIAGNESFDPKELEKRMKNLGQHGIPLGEHNKDTGRDAGLPQDTVYASKVGDRGFAHPPSTPNKAEEFQINNSRDADAVITGDPPAAMHSGGREALDAPNQTEGLLSSLYSQFPNQKMGIHSHSARGVPSPNITPKNTQVGNERSTDQSEKRNPMESKAFQKAGSTEVHELDEKRISREHKFSGVKEQASNSPRQQSPLPNTGGLQTSSTQQPQQQPGMQYGEYGNPPHNINNPYQHMHQQPPPVHSGSYLNQMEDPHRPVHNQNPNDYTQGVGNMPRNPTNRSADPEYIPQERAVAHSGAYDGQMEDPPRYLPNANPNDFSRGVGNMHSQVNKPQNQYNLPANTGAYQGQYDDPYTHDFNRGIDHIRITDPDPRAQGQYERPPAHTGGYPGQYEDPSRQFPNPNTQGFDKRVDSTNYRDRYEQTPANPHNANVDLHQTPPNIPHTGQDPSKDQYMYDPRYNARGRQLPLKDDFSKPVSDQNTGVNDPNPDRNKPHVTYPHHRDDPRFARPVDYQMAQHDDLPYEDEMEMREREMRNTESAMRDTERMRIIEMQRMRDNAGYDVPYRQRPTEHRGYDPPYQPPAQPPAPTTEWTCQHCTIINPPGIRVCTMCSKTAGSLTQTADVMPTATSGIHCKYCMTRNPSTARVCVDCGRGLF